MWRRATKPTFVCFEKLTVSLKRSFKNSLTLCTWRSTTRMRDVKSPGRIGFSVDWRQGVHNGLADLPEIHRVAVREPARERLRDERERIRLFGVLKDQKSHRRP